jgi:hypothetical protein
METNTPMKVELQPSSVGSSLGLGPALRGALGDAATETGGSRWLKPGTLGHVMAQHLDSALMLPLFFQAGEPMMLPFFPIAVE